MNFDIYVHPIPQPEGFSRVEVYLPNETVKALTDLIGKELGKCRESNQNERLNQWLKKAEKYYSES